MGIHSFTSQTVIHKTKLYLLDKKDNIEGLQVIDLILSALARDVLGKRDKMVGNDIDLDLLHAKMACSITFFP